MPTTDTYIEKETDINEEIERLRHASTEALLSRKDVIIVASVSCIYGLGSPEEYSKVRIRLAKGESRQRETIFRSLVNIQYQRNDIEFTRGTFRVRGDVLEIFPSASDERAVRIEFWGDEIENITEVHALTGEKITHLDTIDIYPATHYIAPQQSMKLALTEIATDLQKQSQYFKSREKLLEAQRIQERTRYDIEMMEHVGFVSGIENYSRYFDGRKTGEPPFTLLDYFPKNFLTFIDESHITIPQIRGMYKGDQARKKILVEYGFRLPAALDNRPLTFIEFQKNIENVIYVSATPGPYELEQARIKDKGGNIVELIIRPTGLMDPVIEVRPTHHQIDHLMNEIQNRVSRHQRVLVTTLTKRMAEELADFLKEANVKVHYLHSEIVVLERLEILRDLRLGVYDVVVGINLLREGLDLPEVSLVAILDADKEGFLRSDTSLIQMIGRAARHVDGRVIMYADRLTDSMKRAIAETERRRILQKAYNIQHGITPTSIQKKIQEGRLAGAKAKEIVQTLPDTKKLAPKQRAYLIEELKEKMEIAAKNLEFEKAAEYRDHIQTLKSTARQNAFKK